MLYLLFQLGGQRYALETSRIVEVMPLVVVHPVPHAPPGVAGMFVYRGAALPLIDLSALVVGQPSPSCFSTRIVLVRGAGYLFGLLVERATETIRRDFADFAAAPLGTAPYLGGVATDERGLLRRIELDGLLSTSLRELLVSSAEAFHVTA